MSPRRKSGGLFRSNAAKTVRRHRSANLNLPAPDTRWKLRVREGSGVPKLARGFWSRSSWPGASSVLFGFLLTQTFHSIFLPYIDAYGLCVERQSPYVFP